MRRFHEQKEQALMFRRWKQEMLLHGYDWRNPPTSPDACHCAKGKGSMRKRAPLDCGKTRCAICHYEKFYEPRCRHSELLKAIERELEADSPGHVRG